MWIAVVVVIVVDFHRPVWSVIDDVIDWITFATFGWQFRRQGRVKVVLAESGRHDAIRPSGRRGRRRR